MTPQPYIYCRLHRWEFWKHSVMFGRIWFCTVCRKEQHERE